jgi:hypothetical protein
MHPYMTTELVREHRTRALAPVSRLHTDCHHGSDAYVH